MIKFSSTDDLALNEEPIKLATDLRDLQKKTSMSDELRFEKTAGQTDIHAIALAAYEGTGQNRNGDLFKEAECLEHYKTFVNSGKKSAAGKYDGRALNRHHKNKPTDPKYGNIKAAAYNKKMKRIELIVGLDNDKCAEEIQKIAEGKQINVSMAAKVAYDVCTWCKHKAYDDKTRCEHVPSELGEINKVGEMCGMDNIKPRWFELSIVGRPADRVGMSLKMASAYVPKLGSDYMQIYTGFVPPADELLTISKQASFKRSLIHKLAKLEKRLDGIAKGIHETSEDKYISEHKSKLNQADGIPADVMDTLRKYEPSKLLRALADKGIVFSPEDFMSYLFGEKASTLGNHTKRMKARLPKIFNDIASDAGCCGECVNSEKYEPSGIDMLPKALRSLIGGLFEGHSLEEQPVQGRIMKITIIRKAPGKLKASDSEEISKEAAVVELAEEYAKYKIAALQYMEDHGKLTNEVMLNALLQNR